SGILCITGSRDRSLGVWNLSSAVEGDTEIPYFICSDAHKGWIWKLTSYDDTIYSCSWDTTIKSWKYSYSLHPLSMFQCKTAVTHKRAVLALSISDDVIISASEDQTVAVWDHRAGKVLKQIKLYENKDDENAFPMCLSFNDNLLYVGDTKGQLHLLNPSQGQFNIIKAYDIGHSRKLTCVKHGMGSIMTSSSDGTLRISTPTQEPQTIAIISSKGGEFDYKNNILAIGGTDNTVEFWVPCSS
ncbi:hypothetical protein L9F63_006012, partial [Diploptera punctata]